jgi:N-acyl-D-aspartate/D-glutamate deacylase
MALAGGLARAGRGVFQMVSDFPGDEDDNRAEFGLLRRIAQRAGRPLSFTLAELLDQPEMARTLLDELTICNREGITIRAQVAPRPVGIIYGLDLSYHPFVLSPSFAPLRKLPLAEKVAAMRQPDVRARLLAEPINESRDIFAVRTRWFDTMFVLGDPPNYEPSPESSIAAQARRKGVSPVELAYDLLLERDGRELFFAPGTNFVHGNLDSTFAMMQHPHTIVGLGDGGAHYGMICDASFFTSMLSYWVRDRKGGRLPLPFAVNAITREPARAVGLTDRGVLAPGFKADINVIDFDHLTLRAPEVVQDLPAGGQRLCQRADGYVATILSGVPVYRDGEATGALPGRLLRAA